METIFAENFTTRQDLENYIKAKIGLNSLVNEQEGHLIKGTRKQLKKLNLSDTCVVWGVKVVSTQGSTEKDLKTKKGDKWKE